jgi:hypothetical protein
MFAVHLHIFILSWKNYHLWTFMFVYCHLPITYFTPGVLVGVHVAHVVLCFFFMSYYVSLCSQLQFPHTNDGRFIYTSSCLFYLHYLALFVYSGFQYTLCCVFLRLVDSFSGMSISDCSSVFSKVYCNTLFQLDTEQIIMESHYYAYYTIIVYIVWYNVHDSIISLCLELVKNI